MTAGLNLHNNVQTSCYANKGILRTNLLLPRENAHVIAPGSEAAYNFTVCLKVNWEKEMSAIISELGGENWAAISLPSISANYNVEPEWR